MALTENEKTDAAFALARFAASGVAVVAAALHRGKPINDLDIKHLLKSLASCRAMAPDAADGVFLALAETLAGKHYPSE